MRLKAFLDLGILAHDPFEGRETDREEEVDGEDGPDDSEDDLLQQPHAVRFLLFDRGGIDRRRA